MAISETYSEYILNEILKDILLEGESPTISEIESRYSSQTSSRDLSKPKFNADNYIVSKNEISSATKYNNSNIDIHTDLNILYKHLYKTTDQSINNFDRWETQADLLESRLDDLQERLTSLLLLTQDTAGYFNFFQDDFVDLTRVDAENTNAFIDIAKGIVSLGSNTIQPTKIFLDDLTNQDFEFNILTKNNLVSRSSTARSQLKNITNDINNFWQEIIYTNKPVPVSVELKIKLPSSRNINQIDVNLLMSNQNSSVQITPLLSADDRTYIQLPIDSFTRSIIRNTSFKFATQSVRYIKFIMTKIGFDQIDDTQYVYNFGLTNVSLFEEGFSTSTTSDLISKPLSVLDTDGNVEEFSRITLEVCEDVPDNTSIEYYVAASNDPSFSINDAAFIAIDPITRDSINKPTVLDFGNLDLVTVSGVNIAYDASDTNIDNKFTNPSQTFSRIDSTSGTTAVTSAIESSEQRYTFAHTNERLIDHAFSADFEIAQNTLEVWRNVALKGTTGTVREIARGWGFSDPYYTTTVYVGNSDGVSIDFGSKSIIVNETPRSDVVLFPQGVHKISVHKNNWKYIDYTSVTDLSSLTSNDSLYPYNHRYLIEGFAYPTTYPSNDEKIYRGFDIVAEYLMKEVSIFDFINNLLVNDYSRFAFDLDAKDTGATIDSVSSTKNPTKNIVIKVDENNPDFLNEQFLLRFKSANSLFKYLRFKATLSTESDSLSPVLDAYRVKISV